VSCRCCRCCTVVVVVVLVVVEVVARDGCGGGVAAPYCDAMMVLLLCAVL
jgi:hypothetical protein